MVTGRLRWTVLWRAVMSASKWGWSRNWISSIKKTTPVPWSWAASPMATKRDRRSGPRPVVTNPGGTISLMGGTFWLMGERYNLRPDRGSTLT
jgi:hypothetical protein